MELSIICVNWNSVGYLKECIASIYEHTQGLSFEIIVVDNASPAKDDVDGLKQKFPDILVIKSAANLGFTRANNVGFKHSSGNYVLFLNPDTKLPGPAINIMLTHLKSLPDAGVVGCRLLNTDLSIQTTCIQTFPTILNQVADAEYLHRRWPGCRLWNIAPLFSENGQPIEVEVISGACMLLSREVFERAGLFSEDYFMYADDIDLCYKLRRLGLKNYYVGKASVIHHGGTSSKQRSVSQWATVMKFVAMQRFCDKTRGRAYAVTFRAAMGCAAVGRLMMIALMVPFGNAPSNGTNLRTSSQKWSAVLRWAVGLDKSAVSAARSC